MCLVDIVQHMWYMGDIQQELEWTAFVLIPKGTTYAQGIGLLDTLWKVVEAIIDTCLREISASVKSYMGSAQGGE